MEERRMKKRILCAFILACLTFSAFAGGGSQAGTSAGAKPRIAVSLPPANNAWQARMRQVIDESAARYPDYEWTVKNAVDDNDQLNQLGIFRNDKYDVMIILPGNGTLLTPICESIYNDGTKTIILDRGIESTKYTALVMGDNYGGGQNAARVLGQKLGGKGNIAVLRSYAGIPIDLERYNGFKDTLTKEFPDIKILVEGDGEFNREAGLRAMANILPGYPQIDAVYTQDDETALGALTAIQNERRTDIKYITGFGGTKNTYDKFVAKDPVYVASMSYFPSMGADGVEMAVRILKGGSFPKDTILRSIVVDSSNVNDFMNEAY
jgi:ribose transport system substrate-binding protein